jgi:VirE N-terminal domain
MKQVIDVSYFTNTFLPCFKIKSAPIDRQHIHFPLANGSFVKLIDNVKKLHWSETINAIKKAPGGYVKNKVKLPCFTPSGTFRIRSDWDMISYSQIVHLDYDNLENAAKLKERIVKSPKVFAAFISPSGNGLKVFVKVNSGEDHHQLAWSQVRETFDTLAGIKSDTTARNLSRLCYVSNDSEAYLNEHAEVFEVTPEVKVNVTIPDPSILAASSGAFGWLYNLTMKGKFQGEVFSSGYASSVRNKFLFLFSCNCNRYGISKADAYEFCKSIWVQNNEGLPWHEVTRTVDSAYSHSNEHASFQLPKHVK